MPGRAGEHTDEESWQLVRFIRHLPHLDMSLLESKEVVVTKAA